MPASRNYSSTAGLMHLVGSISGAAASLIVDVTTGLPTAPFTLLLDPGAVVEEVVTVTAVGGTTLTVTRGADGTSAQSHDNGAEIRHAYSARDFQDSRNHEGSVTAHGATGAVVGTSNTQTLINKSISGALNTFTNVPKLALPTDVAYLVEAQTLTNKTMSGASNTFSLIPSAAVVGVDADIAGLATHLADTTAHGAAGAVVGTTNAQTLTNKTLASPLMTGTATAATVSASNLYVGGRHVLHTEADTVTHVYGGGSVGPVSTVVTFDHAYASPPAVALGSASFSVQIEYGGLSTTGFTLYSKGFNNVAPGAGNYNVTWIAAGA